MVEGQIPRAYCRKSNPLLQRIRSIKESEEIDLIQACDITESLEEFSFVKPNVMEYEIEAEFIHNSYIIVPKVLLTHHNRLWK
jgi:Xaa-Pro aminopeptidase